MKNIRIDRSGGCCSALDCFPTQGSRASRKAWIKGTKIMMATLNTGDLRHVTPVRFHGRFGIRHAMMDCVTGTIYKDGRSFSSDRLCIESIDESDYSESLLSKPPVDWRARQW